MLGRDQAERSGIDQIMYGNAGQHMIILETPLFISKMHDVWQAHWYWSNSAAQWCILQGMLTQHAAPVPHMFAGKTEKGLCLMLGEAAA